jgi:molecular chaperone GrpE
MSLLRMARLAGAGRLAGASMLAAPRMLAVVPTYALPSSASAAVVVGPLGGRTGAQVRNASEKVEGIATEPPPEETLRQGKGEAGGGEAAGGAVGEAADPRDAALVTLREETAKLKAQVNELNQVRLRQLAEMENVRMIARRDVDNAKAYGVQSFAKRLLDVADNLHAAVTSVPEDKRASAPGNEALSNLYIGVAATEREMLKTLAAVGVEQYGKVGEKFDPNRHEAMMQAPAPPGTEPNTVLVLLKTGFVMKDRVLRPAQVVVATKPQ